MKTFPPSRKTTELLSEKAQTLDAYLQSHLIDEHGVVYASIESNSQSPWSEASWQKDGDLIHVEGATPWGILNYENCGMTTGATLATLAYRWRVTKDDETLVRAQAALRGLHHIHTIGRQLEPGYFPKIYGGNFSPETSSDQYLYAIKGMMAWYPVAPPEDKALICEMITSMVDFWTRRDYRYDYFGIKDMPWPIGRFPALLYAAYAVTADDKYRKEADRINHEHHATLHPVESQILLRADAGAEFSPYEASIGGKYRGIFIAECSAMDIMGLDECLQHSQHWRGDWLRSMALSWKEGNLSLTESGLAYGCTVYDPATHEAATTAPDWLHEGADPLGWSFLRWTGGFLVPRSTMLARVGVHVAKWLPDLNAVPAIHHILHGVTLPEMRHCIDPDGRQLLPRHHYMTRWVDSDALVNWLWAYWQGRCEGIISGEN